MSQENVELARQYFEAINAKGVGDRTEHLRHPEIEYFDPPNLPDAQRHVGEAAVRGVAQRGMEMGWDGKFHVQEYIDAGDDAVVVWQVRGRSPHGLPFEGTFAYRCRFEDGKLRRQEMSRRLNENWTSAEALEAAGLRE
jgi:ketosteroid isomerase-like protein